LFVKIKVDSTCCQRYGICGEQYVTDIQFDDAGHVSATRFRFQHKPEIYQENFIAGMLETRRAVDMYAKELTTIPGTKTQAAVDM